MIQPIIQTTIHQALFQYALLVLGLTGSLVLFLNMKREMRSQATKQGARIEELASKTYAAPPAAEPVYIAVAPTSGLNVSKRVQAMRMLRRREDVSHVAAALGVTRAEIELLIRVQKLSPAPLNQAPVSSAAS
jgi:hypothetical protein